MRCNRWLQLGAGLLVFVSPLPAQVITGTVADSTGVPLAGAAVSVTQADRTRTVFTSETGRFTLLVAPGALKLEAQALGFEPVASEMTIEKFQRVTLSVMLSAQPLAIAPITVLARRQQSRFGREGFTWRKDRAEKTGMGRVLDRDEIARSNAIFVSDVLRRQPLMRRSFPIGFSGGFVSYAGRESTPRPSANAVNPVTTVSSERYGANTQYCVNGFVYYVDGTITRLTIEDIDGMYAAGDLAGIEIYRKPYEVPGEFGGGLYGCGVIALWTH